MLYAQSERIFESARYHRELPDGFQPAAAAEFIRRNFSNSFARPALIAQLDELAALQFNSQKVWGELAGRIGSRAEILTFEPIPSPGDALVYNALESFRETKSPNAAQTLLREVGEYSSLVSRECVGSVVAKLQALESNLCAVAFEETACPEIDLKFLETVLGSVTRMHVKDLRPKEPDFCGAFHFHPNGEPPNAGDLRQSYLYDLPMIVVAAVDTPRSIKGVYLLQNAKSEQLL